MTRTARPVTQADVERVVKGAIRAGFPVGRIDVDLKRGRVTIMREGETPPDDERDLLEEHRAWRESHDDDRS